MKHLELSKHYRNIIIALINKGFIEEVIPPSTTQQVRMVSKRSDSGLDWSLTIPGPSLVFTIEKGVMFIEYTNIRTNFTWKRDFAAYINGLSRSVSPKVYDDILEELWRMQHLVKGLVRDHLSDNSLQERRNRKRAALKHMLAVANQNEGSQNEKDKVHS